MYRFTPEFHHPKDKKSFKKADIWPADILVDATGANLEYWVMTPDANFVPFSGYNSGYFGGKRKKKHNV